MSEPCNWLPLELSAIICGPDSEEILRDKTCNLPSVQSFTVKVAGQPVKMNRCADHKLSESFIAGVQTSPRT